MDADKVQQWAREAEEFALKECAKFMPSKSVYEVGAYNVTLFNSIFREHFARLARAAAFEEAAKVCIREGEIGRIDGKNTYGECHENASRECARAIRALAAAEKETKP